MDTRGSVDCYGVSGAVRPSGGPKVCVGYLALASEGLIELDRATLHTRLGSAPECRSGVWACAFALVSGSAGWTCSPLRFRVGVAVQSQPGAGRVCSQSQGRVRLQSLCRLGLVDRSL